MPDCQANTLIGFRSGNDSGLKICHLMNCIMPGTLKLPPKGEPSPLVATQLT
jgi:hypothetical protein